MIEINIPGFAEMALEHLVLDYNGTLAFDGVLIKGVRPLLTKLADHINIYIITADTFGTVQRMFEGLSYTVFVISSGSEDLEKVKYVQQLGSRLTTCIGNGRNDRLMLKESALGIAVMQQEGASMEAIMAADVVTTSILDALDLLLNPKRVVATLRC